MAAIAPVGKLASDQSWTWIGFIRGLDLVGLDWIGLDWIGSKF